MSRSRKRSRPIIAEDSDSDDEETTMIEVVGEKDIIFYTPINQRAIAKLQKILLTRPYYVKQLTLHLWSTGGEAYAGLAGYDLLRHAGKKFDITTIIEGECCSAATLLSLGADTRLMIPHGSYMIHQVSGVLSGTLLEMKIDCQNTDWLMQQYVKIYLKYTKMPKGKLLKELLHDGAMSFETAKKLGFITGCI